MSRKTVKKERKKLKSLKSNDKRNIHIKKLETKLLNCVKSGVSRVRDIYIFKTSKDFYKIGVAEHPHKRLKGVQTGSHTEVELIFSMPTHRALNVEALIHAIFSDNRVNGEWFKFNSIELIMVKEEIKKRVV